MRAEAKETVLDAIVGGALLGAAVLGFLAVMAGCSLDLSNSNSNSNQIQIRILPAPTPAPGCGAIQLGATQAAAGAVMLDLDPDGAYTLLDFGVSLGPVADGQVVTLASGTHDLQAVAGPCSSNRVAVTVP